MAVERRPAPHGATSPAALEGARMPEDLDPRMHDALTDLHTYVLALDAERRRLGDRVRELTKLVSQEGAVLPRQRVEIAEELDALRATLVALRACADPA